MSTLLRHVLAIVMLPTVVAVVLPAALLSAPGDSRWIEVGWLVTAARGAGALLLAAGLGLFGWCVVLFARVGRGTLAPWDPTRELVAVGPYRLVRNPMITGVAMVLAGQALWWGSGRVALLTGAFVAVNHVYFVAAEEPGLRRRFGAAYDAYAASVPRWLPRLGLRPRR
jgi:protein-S-isoprenylcysteine O-methyltransferase Ste14